MKKKARRILRILLTLAFVVGVGLMLWQVLQYSAAQQVYAQAQEIAFQPTLPEQIFSEQPTETQQNVPLPTENTPPEANEAPLDDGARFLREVNVFALRQVNPDVLGWIYIPGTDISYPLMQTDDRDEYLGKAWDGSTNRSGSIFLEQKNSRELSDFNTIIYGHHLTNGTMFSPILKYKDQAFFDAHSYIYVATGEVIHRYQVFAAYEAPVSSDTYRLYFADDTAKQTALDHYLQSSALSCALTPDIHDRILTLSTCTGTGIYTTRWVVQAVLTGSWKK